MDVWDIYLGVSRNDKDLDISFSSRLCREQELFNLVIEVFKFFGQLLVLHLSVECLQQTFDTLSALRRLSFIVGLDAGFDEAVADYVGTNAIIFTLGTIISRVDQAHEA